MTWKDRAVIGVLLAALAAVSAGMLVPPPAPVPTPAILTSAPVPYVEGIVGHPSSINPLTVRTQADRDLVALLFRGLLRRGPNGTLLPDLAESWQVSEDGKSYTFALRPDVYWHDGLPITSRDVAYTVSVLEDADYKGPYGVSWRGIGVVQVSQFVVRFELSRPLAGFLQMTTLGLLPEHALAGVPVAQLAGSSFSQHPLGSGMFQLLDLDNSHARVQRVRSVAPAPAQFAEPTSTGALPTQFKLPVRYDTISDMELRFYDTPEQLAADFTAGRLSAAGGLSPALLKSALHRPDAKSISYPLSTMAGVLLNLRPTHKYLQDLDVRAGLLAAIDRKGLVADELDGLGVRADVPIPPSSWAYDSTSVTPVGYDLEAAVASLGKGGWKKDENGAWTAGTPAKAVTLELLTPDAASNLRAYTTAQHVLAAWKAIGLDAKLKPLPAADYIAALRASEFDAAIVDIDLGLDPDLWPLFYSSESVTGGTNISGIQNADLDKLLTTARTALTQDARRTALAELEKWLSAQNPILPLYFGDYSFACVGLDNVSAQQISDPSGRYWDVIDWRLARNG